MLSSHSISHWRSQLGNRRLNIYFLVFEYMNTNPSSSLQLEIRDYCKTFHSEIVPYIQGIAEPIRRVLNNCGIKVALKPFQTLGHIFAKPKDRVPTDRKTHTAYSIPCGDGEKVYLGQTKRQFCTRLKEHQRAVSNFNSSKSALAEHVCVSEHKP